MDTITSAVKLSTSSYFRYLTYKSSTLVISASSPTLFLRTLVNKIIVYTLITKIKSGIYVSIDLTVIVRTSIIEKFKTLTTKKISLFVLSHR